MSDRRAPSPLNLEDMEATLDMEEYSLLHPSTPSSSATAGANRGESSTPSLQPGVFGGGRGGVGAETTPTSTFGKVVFISKEDLGHVCCGKIGTSSRFCIEPKLEGEEHCGVPSHARAKMAGIEGDSFYPPGDGTWQEYSTCRSLSGQR